MTKKIFSNKANSTLIGQVIVIVIIMAILGILILLPILDIGGIYSDQDQKLSENVICKKLTVLTTDEKVALLSNENNSTGKIASENELGKFIQIYDKKNLDY